MNHLEALTEEWLSYNGYFTRSGVRVGRRSMGGWDGELDVVAVHPASKHFVHVECSMDALTWGAREERFAKKLEMGRTHAREVFQGLKVPRKLDQVVLLSYASAPNRHRSVGGGRLVTSQELVAEIMNGIPANQARAAIPESLPLIRTLQLSLMAGSRPLAPMAFLIPAG